VAVRNRRFHAALAQLQIKQGIPATSNMPESLVFSGFPDICSFLLYQISGLHFYISVNKLPVVVFHDFKSFFFLIHNRRCLIFIIRTHPAVINSSASSFHKYAS